MQNESCTRHVPCIRHEPWQFLQFCIKINHLGVILILYICTSLLIQSRCNLAVSSDLFPFPAIQCSHWDDCCQQQHSCLTATHK
jgi:hypothetical protein